MIEPLDQRGRPYMADSTANLGIKKAHTIKYMLFKYLKFINFLCDVP